nr:hypothetical protein [uncultured Novosphingobium sp.]
MTNPKIDCSGVVVKMPLVKNLSYDENRATVLSGLIQALPLDVFVVAPSGKVVLANLTDAALAVLGMDFAQSVNSSFESVLEQLPLDQESRSDIRGHIVRILGGSLLSVSRSYPMLTSRGGGTGRPDHEHCRALRHDPGRAQDRPQGRGAADAAGAAGQNSPGAGRRAPPDRARPS